MAAPVQAVQVHHVQNWKVKFGLSFAQIEFFVSLPTVINDSKTPKLNRQVLMQPGNNYQELLLEDPTDSCQGARTDSP